MIGVERWFIRQRDFPKDSQILPLVGYLALLLLLLLLLLLPLHRVSS